MRLVAILKPAAVAAIAVVMLAVPRAMTAQTAGVVLKPMDMQKLLPASVYYKGQSATVQMRNSGGVKFADGYFVLAALVDTSGYSTSVAAKYQAYFIAEVPIKVGGTDLAAGVYGVGFVAGNKFVVTDVGAHDVLTVNSNDDPGLKRPMPLQVMADPGGGFRLYSGRTYVAFRR